MTLLSRSIRLGLMLCAGNVTGACFILDPTFGEPALIIFYHDTTNITVPDSAARGQSFTVTVSTFGGGCTDAVAHTFKRVNGLVAEIRPYNQTHRSGGCPDVLRFLYHTVTIKFDQPGVATIRVLGEQRPFAGASNKRGPAQLERQVIIH